MESYEDLRRKFTHYRRHNKANVPLIFLPITTNNKNNHYLNEIKRELVRFFQIIRNIIFFRYKYEYKYLPF